MLEILLIPILGVVLITCTITMAFVMYWLFAFLFKCLSDANDFVIGRITTEKEED